MQVRLQRPSDQPTGAFRLLDAVEHALASEEIQDLRMVVAFAKVAPFRKLKAAIRSFREKGGQIKGILGVDALGTSSDALKFAIQELDETWIARAPGPLSSTFHPKVYIAVAETSAEIWLGSNNWTVGGTELNPESLIHLTLDLPADKSQLADIEAYWEDALSFAQPLTSQLLEELVANGVVRSEASLATIKKGKGGSKALSKGWPSIDQKPPRPLPKPPPPGPFDPAGPHSTELAGVGTALAIEVLPHPNGEVFLSKTAVDQNPDFFDWPFSGLTTPKFPGNPAYPQREPDPIVSISVIDSAGNEVVKIDKHPLNTVYYTLKSEIRITVPPPVIQATPDYSILLMALSDGDLDYELTFFAPSSQLHQKLEAACDQNMPSGGKPKARRFGWL